MGRAYNFSAGPATLPLEVLQQVQADLVDYKGTGMSVMEMSHRGKDYDQIHNEAIANFKELCGIGDDYEVLFVQGGASLQFSMIPMNFLGAGQTADYAKEGTWSGKALKEAKIVAALRGANANTICDCAKDIPTRMPRDDEWKFSENPVYTHICTNETISGAQLKKIPEVKGVLIADMSSDILSRRVDVSKYAMIYGGAQKNAGPAGVAFYIIKKDLLGKVSRYIPTMLDLRTHIDKLSMFNTPPVFSIFVMNETLKWLKSIGGIDAIHAIDEKKAATLYAEIDRNSLFTGTAEKEDRSIMNVCFVMAPGHEDLQDEFFAFAKSKGMVGIKGHRSVGGFRASLYNACTQEDVEALVATMKEFEALKK